MIQIAFHSLLRHKLRSFLTMLGVIFGVAAVIAMTSIGEGARQETLQQLKAYGVTNLTIRASRLGLEKLKEAKRKNSVGLSLKDGEYIKEACPFVNAVTCQAIVNKPLRYQKEEPKCNVVGAEPSLTMFATFRPVLGRFISEDDIRFSRRVVVLGHEIHRKLFFNTNPIGQTVRIGGVRFLIIGTLPDCYGKEEKRVGGEKVKLWNRNINQDVYIPITVATTQFISYSWKDYNDSEQDPTYNIVREMIVEISSLDKMKEAKLFIENILLRRHFEVEDFEIVVPYELMQQSQKAQEIFNIVMACIAGLSLLVGGIGIMNIMLANVTEKTKEIGIRQACGARDTDILIQFLTEATILSVSGGIIGILVGVLISKLVTFYTQWATLTPASSIFLAFGVSAGVGIFFGLFPAYQASKMDPIRALRYE